MKKILSFLVALTSLSLSGCGKNTAEDTAILNQKPLNQITAAKTPYAITKGETPVLSIHEWDDIFGGPTGSELSYDRFGEIDQLAFVAPEKTVFSVQREIRKRTRAKKETIYYKVTLSDLASEEELWIDGRFLHLQDIRPSEENIKESSSSDIISLLRSFQGLPYTWHGTSAAGASELLEYYPPAKTLTAREKNDWILKGFDTLGMLFRASHGKTPRQASAIMSAGTGVNPDLSKALSTDQKAAILLAAVKPLDVIVMNDRIWIVLDRSEIIESRYHSKFDGKVEITPLFDTITGLLQKATLVSDPSAELADKTAKRFYIRRLFEAPTPAPEETLPTPKDTTPTAH